jgi:MoaA/NifB/PqqE/SkfB family radical SAM enzyme
MLRRLIRLKKTLSYYNPIQVFRYKRGQVYPIHIFFNITSKCNSNCLYCDKWFNRNTTLSFKDFKIIWDKVKSRFRPKTLMLCGGEIFDHPEIEQILNYLCAKSNIEISGVTSGIFKTRIRKEMLSKFDLLYFSLDGHNRNLHSEFRKRSDFDTVVTSIKEAVKIKKRYHLDTRIGMMCVLSSKNYKFIRDIVLFAESLKIDELAFSTVIDYSTINPKLVNTYSLSKIDHNIIYDMLRHIKKEHKIIVNNNGFMSDYNENNLCFAGKAFFVINERGDCFGCYGSRKPILNLLNADFTDENLKNRNTIGHCDKGCEYYCTRNVNYYLNRFNWF